MSAKKKRKNKELKLKETIRKNEILLVLAYKASNAKKEAMEYFKKGDTFLSYTCTKVNFIENIKRLDNKIAQEDIDLLIKIYTKDKKLIHYKTIADRINLL